MSILSCAQYNVHLVVDTLGEWWGHAKKLKIPFPNKEGLLALQEKIEEKLKTSDIKTHVETLIEGIKKSDPLVVFLMLTLLEKVDGRDLFDIIGKLPHICNQAFYQALVFRLYDLAIKLPEDKTKFTILDQFVTVFLEFQDVNKASEAAKAIQDPSLETKDLALIKIVEHLARKKETSQAFEVVKALHDPDSQAIGLSVVLVLNDEIDQAKEKASAILDDDNRSFAFYKIALILIEEGRIDQAREAADRIPDPEWKSITLEKIAFLLIQKEVLKEAEEVANRILDEPYKSRTLFVLSSTLMSKGNFDGAEDIAKRIPNENMQFSLLRRLEKFRCSPSSE